MIQCKRCSIQDCKKKWDEIGNPVQVQALPNLQGWVYYYDLFLPAALRIVLPFLSLRVVLPRLLLLLCEQSLSELLGSFLNQLKPLSRRCFNSRRLLQEKAGCRQRLRLLKGCARPMKKPPVSPFLHRGKIFEK